MALFFVELLDLDKPPRSVDCTLLALVLPLLNFAVNDLPVFGCAIFTEAPFLELTLVLAFAVDGLGAYPSIHAEDR